MFSKEVIILSDILIVEIGDAQIQQNIDKESEIEQREINSEILRSNRTLHLPVNT